MLTELTERIKRSLATEMPARQSLLSNEEIENLRDACSKAFGEPIHPEIIEQIATYCSYVDDRINGRAAGKIEDLVIRFLFRYYASRIESTPGRNVCHIEIGVLFGAGVIYAYEAARLAGKRVPVLAIDPFEGYYGAAVDPISKLEVTDERFRHNLTLFNVDEGVVQLLRGFSTDPAIYEPCRSRSVLSVLIDGDHSYKGVLSDWKNFSAPVVPGGYVLIDDYRNPSWPDMTRCVDKEILPSLRSEWTPRLVFGRSLLLQRSAAGSAGGI